MTANPSTLRPFPDSFRFGVATADHQVEAYDAAHEDVTDLWEQTSHKTVRGRATDFWKRYEEDIALAQSLGCKIFRLSMSWSRLEPEPGHYNELAFEHYHKVIAAVRAAGMEPIVTIVHFAWPLHIEARGGLISDEFPAIFERYATEIARRFGREARYWIPFNEPDIMMLGYISFGGGTNYNLPPGFPDGTTLPQQLDAIAALTRNLFLAHTAARKALKAVNPDAQIGCNPNGLGMPGWLQAWLDRNLIRLRSPDDMRAKARRYAARPLLEKGKADVVLATLTRTDERSREVAFSRTYFVAGQTLLVLAGSPVKGVADLAGKPVGVVRTSTAESALASLVPGALPRPYGTYAAAQADLDTGGVQAILGDNVILEGLIAKTPGKYLLVGGLLTSEPYAAAVSLGSYELLEVVNQAIQQFKDSGEWAASYARNFPGQPVPGIPRGALRAQTPRPFTGGIPKAAAGTALRRIQDRGYIVIAIKTDVRGMGYFDPVTQEYTGLEIDIARKLSTVLFGNPDHIRFLPATTSERIPFLRSLLRFLDPIFYLYNVFSTWLNANWWHLGMAGQLPEFFCPPECVGQQDFVGFDYYWGISSLHLDRIRHLLDAYITSRDMTRVPVWPAGMYNAIKYCANLFPGLPIMVIENGCIETADGISRADYLPLHIKEVQRAIADGMNVTAYICWSITSNREWGLKFEGTSDYGLYHIELDTDADLKRVSTPAAEVYRQIIRNRGV